MVGERCTALHGVPTHFLGVLSEVEKRKEADDAPNMYSLRFVVEILWTFISYQLSANTYRTGIAAGSPIPIDLMKNLIEKMNLRDLTNAYGMSTFHSSIVYSFGILT